MGRTKLFLVVVGVLLMGLVSSSATGAPFDSAEHSDGCSSIVVDPTVVCESDSSANAGTGRLTASTSSVSRLQTYAPSVASNGNAFASVARLVENGPVSALKLTATIHIANASVHVIRRPAVVGYVNASLLAQIRPVEKSSRCYLFDANCAFHGGSAEILSLRETGDLTMTNESIVVSGILFACGGLPAGAADVFVELSAASQIGTLTAPGAGEAKASIDATVTNLVVEPVPVPPGGCF